MDDNKHFEIQIKGMDCTDCTLHVKKALSEVPYVLSADVFLGSEKAIVFYKNRKPSSEEIIRAVKGAGYKATIDTSVVTSNERIHDMRKLGRMSIFLFVGIVIFVLGLTLIGEQMGLLSRLENFIPWYAWLAAIMLGGYPVFSQVYRALRKKRIISHTLMTASVLTAIIVGEWATALLIVLFMRLGDFIEKNTTEKARQAVRKLKMAAPQTAHVIVDGQEVDVPIIALRKGDIVQVKPGEGIPVDGVVLEGKAVVDQSAISGESMPAEILPGDKTHAASTIHSGTLRIETVAAGKESLFGRIITMVENAEANRGEIQSIADRFSAIYLPIVGLVALATYLISGNPIAAASVMAVSCSCSFSLATPVAMLASIGSAAQQGLLIKGGKYIETLEKIDTVFIDKTGTLTLGQPSITDFYAAEGFAKSEIIQLAAAVEQYSEHPLANAVLRYAQEQGTEILKCEKFVSEIGQGVSGWVNGMYVQILNQPIRSDETDEEFSKQLLNDGKTILYVHLDRKLAAIMGAEDVLRLDARQALDDLKDNGIKQITLISGDHTAAVRHTADQLGIVFKAGMLPQEKIALVKKAQQNGKRVMMIGDGVNDSPALAQADIGIAMGARGTDIAIETAHIVLLREDWNLVPQAFRIAERTMRIVRINIMLTALYNLAGITLAAIGLLAPAVAAAMQSIPDIGIMANSARLLKEK